jgi:hypothetical protein
MYKTPRRICLSLAFPGNTRKTRGVSSAPSEDRLSCSPASRRAAALFALASCLAAAADTPKAQASLSAAEIVAKNVAARGGLEAWRAVKTMSLSGKMGVGGNQRATLRVPESAPQLVTRKNGQQVLPSRPVEERYLPFVLELARPHKRRFELQFGGQTAIQVYDGAQGWKLRPYLNRRVVESFTEDELKISATQPDLDGPLVDYQAKGTKLELVGMEKVDDHDTYKVKMTMQDGQAVHVWIDAQTFLEAKIEGQPRRMDGTEHPVEVYYHDYRTVDGLQIPFLMETRVLPVKNTATGLRDVPVPPEKVIIDKVTVNPKFDEALFSKPAAALSAAARQSR